MNLASSDSRASETTTRPSKEQLLTQNIELKECLLSYVETDEVSKRAHQPVRVKNCRKKVSQKFGTKKTFPDSSFKKKKKKEEEVFNSINLTTLQTFLLVVNVKEEGRGERESFKSCSHCYR